MKSVKDLESKRQVFERSIKIILQNPGLFYETKFQLSDTEFLTFQRNKKNDHTNNLTDFWDVHLQVPGFESLPRGVTKPGDNNKTAHLYSFKTRSSHSDIDEIITEIFVNYVYAKINPNLFNFEKIKCVKGLEVDMGETHISLDLINTRNQSLLKTPYLNFYRQDAKEIILSTYASALVMHIENWDIEFS